jgi:anti-anti-sigma regulatory factor
MDNPRLTITTAGNPAVWHGTGALDIYEIESARADLLAHLAGHSGLQLNLTAITTCDTAGAQLLCAAQKSASQAGKPCTIEMSACIRECFERLGLPATMFSGPPA